MELNGTLSSDQIQTLSTVYLLSLSPSLIGSSSVLLVSIARWRHLQHQVLPLVQLALADLLAGLILMFTSAMNIVPGFSVLSTHSIVICQHALPLSLTFYFVSFLLVVVYAWKSKYAMRGWRATQGENEREQSQCWMRILAVLPLYAFVWLIPIALYIIYVFTNALTEAKLYPPHHASTNGIVETSKYCNSCILFLHIWNQDDPCSQTEKFHDIFVNVFLVLAVIPVLVYCSVIYYKVGSWYHRHEQEGLFPVEGDGLSRRRLRTMFSTARNMVAIIIICWAPALVLIVLSNLTAWANVGQQNLFVLYIIQAVTVSLHGFLNSIVYAWRRANFTEAVLGERTPLVDRQAFFDESLHSMMTCDPSKHLKTYTHL